jgi:hypothetical protein
MALGTLSASILAPRIALCRGVTSKGSGKSVHSSTDRSGNYRRATLLPSFLYLAKGRNSPPAPLRFRGTKSDVYAGEFRAHGASAHASGGIGEKLAEPCRRRSHQRSQAVAGALSRAHLTGRSVRPLPASPCRRSQASQKSIFIPGDHLTVPHLSMPPRAN